MEYIEISYKDQHLKVDATDIAQVTVFPREIYVTRYLRNTAGHFYRRAETDGRLMEIANMVEHYEW